MSKKPARKPGIALLGIADKYIDAMMWKDMLEQQSIPCMVRDGSATIGDLQGPLPFGPGQFEAYVPASAMERSRRILGDLLKPPLRPAPTPGDFPYALAWLGVLGFAVSFAIGLAIMLGIR